MLTLFASLFVLLMMALVLLFIPYRRSAAQKNFYWVAVVMTLVALMIYQSIGDKVALGYWLTQGKQHYQLQEQFIALGGLEGAIHRIEETLQKHPEDSQGWTILGKLYLAKQDKKAAKAAFERAGLAKNKA